MENPESALVIYQGVTEEDRMADKEQSFEDKQMDVDNEDDIHYTWDVVGTKLIFFEEPFVTEPYNPHELSDDLRVVVYNVEDYKRTRSEIYHDWIGHFKSMPFRDIENRSLIVAITEVAKYATSDDVIAAEHQEGDQEFERPAHLEIIIEEPPSEDDRDIQVEFSGEFEDLNTEGADFHGYEYADSDSSIKEIQPNEEADEVVEIELETDPEIPVEPSESAQETPEVRQPEPERT